MAITPQGRYCEWPHVKLGTLKLGGRLRKELTQGQSQRRRETKSWGHFRGAASHRAAPAHSPSLCLGGQQTLPLSLTLPCGGLCPAPER